MIETPRGVAAVVGSGISGLSCAYQLAHTGWSVRVISALQSENTTSATAAAIWWPYDPGPRPVARTWALTTLNHFRDLATATPEAGVRMRYGTYLKRMEAQAPWFFDVLERQLGAGTRELRMTVPIIDMPVHLHWLQNECTSLGVNFEFRQLTNLNEIENADLIVNCSGLGSQTLVNDPYMQPLRGQVVIMRDTGIEKFTKDGRTVGIATYIYPRLETTILGGTVEKSADTHVDAATTKSIIKRCAELDPRVKDGEIIDVRVGHRPNRGVIRVEIDKDAKVPVIHNYGHGRSGVSLSWGCAQQVTQLCNAWDNGGRR